jgi:hypothetical protein
MTRSVDETLGAAPPRAPEHVEAHGSRQQAVLLYGTAFAYHGSSSKPMIVALLAALLELPPVFAAILGRGVLAVFLWLREA